MAQLPDAFRLLSHREFCELTHDEKLAYLNSAVEQQLALEAPVVAAIPPPKEEA
jgi:hypothetical protein